MRALFLSSGLGVGGAELALERLIPQLQARGVVCAVASLRELGPVGERMRAAGIEVHALGMRPPRPSIAGFVRLWRLVRQFRPDVLQGWMYHGNIAAQFARLAAPSAKICGAIHQTLARPEMDPWTTRAVIRLDAWLSYLAARTIYVARSAETQHLARGYSQRAACFIPNGFDTAAFAPDESMRSAMRAELGLMPEHFVFGAVGRFHPVKDQASFLKAAALNAEQAPHARFVMVGEGLTQDNVELAPLLAQPELQGRVQMLGRRDDVPRLMQALDVLVLSSLSEGLPNVVAEAMSCAVPCVVTDVGDTAWMVGETGWVVPPGDAQQLADGMHAALRADPAMRNARGEAARKRIADHFSIEVVAQAYLSLYEDLLNTAG